MFPFINNYHRSLTMGSALEGFKGGLEAGSKPHGAREVVCSRDCKAVLLSKAYRGYCEPCDMELLRFRVV